MAARQAGIKLKVRLLDNYSGDGENTTLEWMTTHVGQLIGASRFCELVHPRPLAGGQPAARTGIALDLLVPPVPLANRRPRVSFAHRRRVRSPERSHSNRSLLLRRSRGPLFPVSNRSMRGIACAA